MRAQEPPGNLAKLVAHRESETEAERNQYTYRQMVTLEELDNRGVARGAYKEVRDVIFSPEQERTDRMIGRPENSLKALKLTEEDFRDIREIQPFVLTEERLWSYETRFRGEETMDGIDCWVLEARPRQILIPQSKAERLSVNTPILIIASLCVNSLLPFSQVPWMSEGRNCMVSMF